MSKRIQFFLTHLSISICIALFVVSIVFFIWYSYPLAKAVGVTHIFLLLIVTDVIVGPILCLIIYKEGKKTLKFDLAVIILIQISAFLYGFYSIAYARPVWIVYSVDRFELVRHHELINDHLDQAQPKFRNPTWFKPKFVAIQLSTDPKQRSKDMFNEVLGGVTLSQRPERYVELNKVNNEIQEKAQPLNQLQQFNAQKRVEVMINQYPQANAWLPLKANQKDMVVLINKEMPEIIQIVDLNPWK